jgi:DNA-binding beta-propeller fold protein YncE
MTTHTLDLRFVAVACTLLALVLPLSARGGEGLGLAESACLAQVNPGDEVEGNTKACTRGKALMGATAVAVSADGKNVYVASSGSDALVSFGRSGAFGDLTELGCTSNNGTTGLDGTKGSCADGDVLRGATAIAMSPDAKNVYVASYASSGIAVFARDAVTGKLTQTGCVRPVSMCVGAGGLGGATSIAVSPDGKNVYLASYNADAIVSFARDTATGALKGLGCLSDDGNDRQCGSGNALRGPNALVISPDGRFVYVAASESNSVLTFERDPLTGTLTQRGCQLDSAPRKGSCVTANALVTPAALALAPDGRTLFVASYDSNAIAVFARDPLTGKLTQRGCLSDVTYLDEPDAKDGCVHTTTLASPTALAVSRDGRRLYVTVDSGFTILDRDATNGGLRLAGCATYSDYYNDDDTKDCVVAKGLAGTAGLSVSPDGRNLYVAASSSNAVTTFTPAASVFARHLGKRGLLAVHVQCPKPLESACAGRVTLTQTRGALAAAQPKAFSVAPGGSTVLFLKLKQALLASATHGRRVKLMLSATDRQRRDAPVVHRIYLERNAGRPARWPHGG